MIETLGTITGIALAIQLIVITAITLVVYLNNREKKDYKSSNKKEGKG